MAVEVYINDSKLGAFDHHLSLGALNRENICLNHYTGSDNSIIIEPSADFTADYINDWKQQAVNSEIEKQAEDLKSKYIWTINSIEPKDGKFFILGCEGVSTGASNGTSRMPRLGKTSPVLTLNQDSTLNLFKNTPADYLLENLSEYLKSLLEDNACADLVKCQMAMYHYLNDILHRLLSDAPPYGLFYHLAAAKACWNLYVFKESLSVSVDSLKDGIFMDTYYRNETSKDVQLTVVFDIKNLTDFLDIEGDDLAGEIDTNNPNGGTGTGQEYDLDKDWGSAGWLAIYLNQANPLLDTGVYQIIRDGVDITDINKCAWEYVGFKAGKITQQVLIPVGEVLHTVYAISKNPNINGFTTYGTWCEFEVTAKAYIQEFEPSEESDSTPTEYPAPNAPPVFEPYGELEFEKTFNAKCCKLYRGTNLAYKEE